MNNILILFDKDSNKKYFSFPLSTTEEEALRLCQDDNFVFLSHEYISNSSFPLSHYENDNKEKDLGPKEILIRHQINRIKEYRSSFLSTLDIPFMRALEIDDPSIKNHIIKLKTFLRDLPQNLRFQQLKDEEISRYNPFNIITQVFLISTGEGYLRPPAIRISPPDGPYFGFPPKVTLFIKNGQVVKLEVTEFGCGYSSPPIIQIEPPKDKDGNYLDDLAARAFFSPVELSISPQ